MSAALPHNANRLALGLMAARNVGYDEAVATLKSLSLFLVCDEEIRCSPSLQAALLTAINCGRRAFLGGTRVMIPEDVRLLVPWPHHRTLNEASQTVYFGYRPEHPAPRSLTVCATGWRGGVEPAVGESAFENGGEFDFALGGVLAGGLAVHRGFLRVSGISSFACDESAGVSLWNPEAGWLTRNAEGPALRALPQGAWMLGLGHLGQAYVWTLGLMPFADPAECELMLQDFDAVEPANVGTGLLSAESDIGISKARVCARWLEARGFRTRLCERSFDEDTRCGPSEPPIALCGFDKSEPRKILEDAGFLRIIECGLGGSINDFDLIHVHNFPGMRTARSIWQSAARPTIPNQKVVAALSSPDEQCGALAIETAGKAVSTSFVGAMAGAMAIGELIRAYHRGPKFDELFFSPRNLADSDWIRSEQRYVTSEIAPVGFASVAAPSSCL
jgi:hypothetical protein